MAMCDLCSEVLQGNGKRYPAADMKAAVRAGLRPPASGMDLLVSTVDLLLAVSGVGPSPIEAAWVAQVMDDSTDWLLCPACGSRVEEFLSRPRRRPLPG